MEQRRNSRKAGIPGRTGQIGGRERPAESGQAPAPESGKGGRGTARNSDEASGLLPQLNPAVGPDDFVTDFNRNIFGSWQNGSKAARSRMGGDVETALGRGGIQAD